MKRLLLLGALVLFVTGCGTNSEVEKFKEYLSTVDFNCGETACNLSSNDSEGGSLAFTNIDFDKKVMTYGLVLDDENQIFVNYEYKKNMSTSEYRISIYNISSTYNFTTDTFECNYEDETICNQIKNLNTTNYDLFQEYITKSNIDVNKL